RLLPERQGPCFPPIVPDRGQSPFEEGSQRLEHDRNAGVRRPRLPYGLYDRVVDLGLQDTLASIEPLAVAECAPLDDGESHTVLARHLAALLARSLAGIKGPSCLARQIDVCNRVVALLSQEDPELTPANHAVCDQAQRLLAVVARQPVIVAEPPERPET